MQGDYGDWLELRSALVKFINLRCPVADWDEYLLDYEDRAALMQATVAMGEQFLDSILFTKGDGLIAQRYVASKALTCFHSPLGCGLEGQGFF